MIKEKKDQIEILEKQIQEINRLIGPKETERDELCSQIRKLEKEITVLTFKNLLPLTPEKVVTANYRLFEQEESFKALNDYMRQFKVVDVSGYYPSTETKAVKIRLSQNKPLAEQVEEVNQFLPYLPSWNYSEVYQRGEDDRVKFGLGEKIRLLKIFEYTLSESGVYELVVDENNLAAVICTRYSLSRIEKVLPYNEIMQYVYQNHPYSRKRAGD